MHSFENPTDWWDTGADWCQLTGVKHQYHTTRHQNIKITCLILCRYPLSPTKTSLSGRWIDAISGWCPVGCGEEPLCIWLSLLPPNFPDWDLGTLEVRPSDLGHFCTLTGHISAGWRPLLSGSAFTFWRVKVLAVGVLVSVCDMGGAWVVCVKVLVTWMLGSFPREHRI